MTQATADVEAVVLTSAQVDAVMQAVEVLNFFAGEGMCAPNGIGADDALYDLANAFMPEWDGDDEYPAAFRARLLSETANEPR